VINLRLPYINVNRLNLKYIRPYIKTV